MFVSELTKPPSKQINIIFLQMLSEFEQKKIISSQYNFYPQISSFLGFVLASMDCLGP